MISRQQSDVVREAILRSIAKSESVEGATDAVMDLLVEMKVLDQPDSVSLLSAAGRTLAMIVECPDVTVREMALRMGMGESSVQRSVSALVGRGLVSRMRVSRRNHYEIDREVVEGHPDIRRFVLAIIGMLDPPK